MPLTSQLPSRECIAYYKLLLHGAAAEPGKSAKEYQLVLNNVLKTKKGKMIEIPALEDDPTEAAPYGIIVPGPEVPPVPPRKRPKAAPGPSRTHPGVAKGSAAGASAPPPGPIASLVPLPPLPPVGGGIIAGPPVPLQGASAVGGGIIAGPPLAPAAPGKRRLLGRDWLPAMGGREMQYTDYVAPHP